MFALLSIFTTGFVLVHIGYFQLLEHLATGACMRLHGKTLAVIYNVNFYQSQS